MFQSSSVKKQQTGFTLVEIMIAVVIIGILSFIAIPSYTNYVRRAEVQEAMVLAESAKVYMVNYHLKKGHFTPNHADHNQRNNETGLADTLSYKTKSINRLWVGSGKVDNVNNKNVGHIGIRLNTGKFGTGSNQLMYYIVAENGKYKMTCNHKYGSWRSTVKKKYLPASCKH